MIQIHLKNRSKFANVYELSEEYRKLVKPLVTSRAKAIREIFNYMISGTAPNFRGIHKPAMLNIMALLCAKKISHKAPFANNAEKIAFLTKHRGAARTIFNTTALRAEFRELLRFLSDEAPVAGHSLTQLIESDPTVLETINTDLKNAFASVLSKKPVPKILQYALDYSQIHKKVEISRLIFDNLDVNACPYCNRNYISYIEYAGKKQIGPTLDHFFAKSEHPFLTASFFNLIPSCYVCNSNIKGAQEATLTDNLNPFFHGFGEVATFELINTPRNYGAKLVVHHAKDPVIAGKIKSTADPKKGNAVMFKTQEIYSVGHHDDIKMILKKCDRVDSYYKSNLGNIRKIHGSVEEFYRIYFSSELDDKMFNTYPLSKLKRDLVRERLPWLLI